MKQNWESIPPEYDCGCLGVSAIDGPPYKNVVKMGCQWYCWSSVFSFSRSISGCPCFLLVTSSSFPQLIQTSTLSCSPYTIVEMILPLLFPAFPDKTEFITLFSRLRSPSEPRYPLVPCGETICFVRTGHPREMYVTDNMRAQHRPALFPHS